MTDDNKIRQQFQSKFSDFRLPAPEDGWQRLEQSLAAVPAATVLLHRRRWWYAGSVAAVLLVLVGSLLFLRNPQTDVPPVVSQAIEKVSPQPAQSGALPQPPQADVKERFVVQKTAAPQEPVSQKTETSVSRSMQTEAIALFGSNHKKYVAAKNPAKPIDITVRHSSRKQNQLSADRFSAPENAHTLLAEARHTETKQKMMISLSGRGGLNSYQKTVNSPMMLRSATAGHDGFGGNNKFAADNKVLMQGNTANNIAEKEHAQPVSFGLLVAKPLFDGFSVETGLVYTYLHSKARNTNIGSKIQETQCFHYLGIPLNINYNVFSFSGLDVYVSAGGMVEKDVAGKRQFQAEIPAVSDGVSEEWISERIKQENPQISVNAGIGMSYPVYNKINMYGKIGGSYYFNAKNTHNTIYSDKKLMLDLNVGFRYEF